MESIPMKPEESKVWNTDAWWLNCSNIWSHLTSLVIYLPQIFELNRLSQVTWVLQLSCLCDRVTALQEAYGESRQAEVRTRSKQTHPETKTWDNTTPAADRRHKIQTPGMASKQGGRRFKYTARDRKTNVIWGHNLPIGQYWSYMLKLFTVNETEIYVEQNVNHFSFLSPKIHSMTPKSKKSFFIHTPQHANTKFLQCIFSKNMK